MSNSPDILTATMTVSYARHQFNKTEDALIVKQRVLDKRTGIERPKLGIIKNFKRPFWVTKKNNRNHKQKRDVELLENCNRYECTQAALPSTVRKALGINSSFPQPFNVIKNNPYLYGVDVKPEVIYQEQASKREAGINGDWKPSFSVAVLDFETNVHSPEEEIISGSLTCKENVFVVYTKAFLDDPEADKKIKLYAQKHIPKELKDRNVTIRTKMVDNEYEVARLLISAAHHIKPDLLAIWNMKFDIGKILKACERFHKDPADLFSDPSIPKEYRFFEWRESAAFMTSTSGKKKTKDPSDAWHKLYAPSSFYVIDAMCVYRMLRVMKGKRHSYSLDSVLEDEIHIRKLIVEGVEGDHNLNWHRYMQKNLKYDYLVYNIFDCMSIELLDEFTQDLARKIMLYADGTNLHDINSNPKRLANSLHFFLEERGKAINCVGKDGLGMEDDKFIPDKTDRIVTLANELCYKPGLNIYKYFPTLKTRVTKDVADVDVTSGYPSAQVICNVCKSTTLMEVCGIQGLDTDGIKRLSVNLTGISANSYTMATELLKLPTVSYWDNLVAQKAANDSVNYEQKAA